MGHVRRPHRSLWSGGGVAPPVPPSDGEPVFGADPTDTLLVSEGFDSYSTVSDFIAQQTLPGLHLGDPEGGGAASLVTGRSGSGKAYRFTYNTSISQDIHKLTTYRDGHSYGLDAQNPWTNLTNGGRTVIVQDWRRVVIAPDTLAQFDEFSMKHMEFIYPVTSNLRQLFNTGNHLPYATVWSSGALFKDIGKDETFTDGAQTYQHPSMTDVVQGAAWYHSTWMYRGHTSGAQKDGEGRLWVTVPSLGYASTELSRIRQDAVGVIPPNPDVPGSSTDGFGNPTGDGQWLPWCHQKDVDVLSFNGTSYEQGVGAINWWHQLIGLPATVTHLVVDTDDVLIWTRGP